MEYLSDTGILLRLVNTADVQHPLVLQATQRLLAKGERIWITPQVLIEFRNVATRPISVNGLGLSPAIVAQETAKIEALFPMLPDTPAIYPAWKALVDAHGVSGKQVHDTRLVAVCHVHQVGHLLTFNVKDFLRFQAAGPGLTALDPRTI